MPRLLRLLTMSFVAMSALAAVWLTAQTAAAGITPKKLSALGPRHETRMQRHEERVRRMEGVTAAYDPSQRMLAIEQRIADLGARHDARVAQGAALARSDALARDAALDRPPGSGGGPSTTPWIPKPPRR